MDGREGGMHGDEDDGTTYHVRTRTYDAGGKLIKIEDDGDNDGTVDRFALYIWEKGPCSGTWTFNHPEEIALGLACN